MTTARELHDDLHVFLAYTGTPVRVDRHGATLAHMSQRLPARRRLRPVFRGAIDDDLTALRAYFGLGVRGIQLADDDGSPAWMDACHAPPMPATSPTSAGT